VGYQSPEWHKIWKIPILDNSSRIFQKNNLKKNAASIYVQGLLIPYPDSRGAKAGRIDNITVPFI
jgi:hypothetical protein